jgi:hypothetical protein
MKKLNWKKGRRNFNGGWVAGGGGGVGLGGGWVAMLVAHPLATAALLSSNSDIHQKS